MKNKKKVRNIIITVLVILVIGMIANRVYTAWQEKRDAAVEQAKVNQQADQAIEVETTTISAKSSEGDYIETVGTVTPDTQIDVVALSQGTIESLPFDIGDKIGVNQTLAYLRSDSTKTGFLNSQTNYYNMLNNLEAVKRSTDDAVRQAELGVERADEAIETAQIALKSTEDNYATSLDLQTQSLSSAQTSAITSYANYIQTVKDSLEDINYIIHAEDGQQLTGIEQTLSAQDLNALNIAKNDYLTTKNTYNSLKNVSLDNNNISYYLEKVIDLLKQTKTTVNDTIIVLDNTVANNNFSQSTLDAQQTAFSNLYTQVVNTLQQAETSNNSLTSVTLNQSKETLALKNAVDSAQNQLNLANIGYNNSVAVLNSARQTKQQQILSAQSSVDNALGQLNLSQDQLSDLTIKASISGQITSKQVQVGAEVSPGQKIAQIAQTDKVKIKVSLSSEDIYQIKLGQTAIINENVEGQITSISPSADPTTKKVEIEISIDNKDGKLITGTFVNIKIHKTNSSVLEDGKIKLPLEAVNISQTENYIFVAQTDPNTNETVAKKQLVSIGETSANQIEVTAGLKIGDQVVVSGSKLLEDGDKIIIK